MDKKPETDTYIRDVQYPSSYQPLQNPLNFRLAASLRGKSHRKSMDEFKYCDLGCGTGASLNLLAVLFPGATFTGLDFNPDHIREARRVAEAAGLENVHYHEMAFSGLDDAEIEKQDYISCVGTFSWIHATQREKIINFVGRRLNDGGMFLVHYAAKPGKAQIDPLWHFMRVMTDQMQGDSLERARAGAGMLRDLHAKNAAFFRLNPVAAIREKQIEGQDLNYISHEALTEWQALNHAEVAGSLWGQGLEFLGSANPIDNYHGFSIPAVFHKDIASITDSIARETYIDYILNRGLRWDIYIKNDKGGSSSRGDITLGLPGITGTLPEILKVPDNREFRINPDISNALLEVFRNQPMTRQAALENDRMSIYEEGRVVNNLDVLIACRIIVPVTGELMAVDSNQTLQLQLTSSLAGLLLDEALGNRQGCFLPAMNTGHAIYFNLATLLMLKILLMRHADLSAEALMTMASELGLEDLPGKIVSENLDVSQSLKQGYDRFRQNTVPALIRIGVLKYPT